jgi:hypothetical protein
MSRRLAASFVSVLLIAAVGAGVWWFAAPAALPDDEAVALPVPPFPPRITEGSSYEACLTTKPA